MQPQMRSSLGQTHCQLLFANGYHALGQVVVVFREEAHGEHDVVDVVEYLYFIVSRFYTEVECAGLSNRRYVSISAAGRVYWGLGARIRLPEHLDFRILLSL